MKGSKIYRGTPTPGYAPEQYSNPISDFRVAHLLAHHGWSLARVDFATRVGIAQMIYKGGRCYLRMKESAK